MFSRAPVRPYRAAGDPDPERGDAPGVDNFHFSGS